MYVCVYGCGQCVRCSDVSLEGVRVGVLRRGRPVTGDRCVAHLCCLCSLTLLQMKALAQLTDEEIENTVSQLQGQLV